MHFSVYAYAKINENTFAFKLSQYLVSLLLGEACLMRCNLHDVKGTK